MLSFNGSERSLPGTGSFRATPPFSITKRVCTRRTSGGIAPKSFEQLECFAWFEESRGKHRVLLTFPPVTNSRRCLKNNPKNKNFDSSSTSDWADLQVFWGWMEQRGWRWIDMLVTSLFDTIFIWNWTCRNIVCRNFTFHFIRVEICLICLITNLKWRMTIEIMEYVKLQCGYKL